MSKESLHGSERKHLLRWSFVVIDNREKRGVRVMEPGSSKVHYLRIDPASVKRGEAIEFIQRGKNMDGSLKGEMMRSEPLVPASAEEVETAPPPVGHAEELLSSEEIATLDSSEADDDFHAESSESGPSTYRIPRYIVGIVKSDEEGGTYVHIDRDAGYPQGILKQIPERVDAAPGMAPGKVVALRREDLTDEVQWVMQEICGDVGESKAEVRALAYRSNVSPEFSDRAQAQVAHLKARYESVTGPEDTHDTAFMEAEAKRYVDKEGKEHADGTLVREKGEYVHGKSRLDLRDREDIDIFTIDPEDARDFDDAISYREVMRDGKKFYEIGVHIADVAHFVRKGSALERDARSRQFTRYLNVETVTMLPEFISNKLASLEPGKDRLSYSTIFTFAEDGTELEGERWFGRALIRSKARLTYEGADAVLENAGDERSARMTKIRGFTERMRGDRGAIAFDQRPEARAKFNTETERFEAITPKGRARTSLMIEDLMLAANEAQGAYLRDRFGEDAPLLLRAHDAPPAKSVARAIGRLLSLDRTHPDNAELIRIQKEYESIKAVSGEAEAERKFVETGAVPATINLLQKRARETGIPKVRAMLEQSLRMLLKRARYTTEREKHFSLAVEPYLHATSPIRRYPDIIVQYLMDKAQLGEAAGEAQDVPTELLVEAAERANMALALSRRSQDDVNRIAFMDIIEDKIGTVSRSIVSFSGPNAVVKDADLRRGLLVNLKLEGGYEHAVWIPWKETGAYQNAEGRWRFRYRKGGKSFDEDARSHFGPEREGVKTLDVRITGVDRERRIAKYRVEGTKIYKESKTKEGQTGRGKGGARQSPRRRGGPK